MRIALGQLNCRLGDSAGNERALLDAAEEARRAGADVLVAPELQLSGYALSGSPDRSRTAEEVAALCAGRGVQVVAGFHERAGERRHNTAAWIDEDGRPVHVHRKLYLCDYPPFDEDLLFAPGETMRSFDTAHGRAAILVCNDAWQPFLPALAAHDGAELLVIPAASSTTVPEAEGCWRDLTRLYARLLECYVVFANQAGAAGGLDFWGGSHVVDPLGEVVAEAGRDEAVLVADVDLDRVAARRRELPLLGNLRPELLRAELERLTAAIR